jgi:hypothetical protein
MTTAAGGYPTDRWKGGALFYNYLPVAPQQNTERSKLGTNKELARKSGNAMLLLVSR